MPSPGKVLVSPLRRLAEALAELAANGSNKELIIALDLCIGFADTITADRDLDAMLAELSESASTHRNPLHLPN